MRRWLAALVWGLLVGCATEQAPRGSSAVSRRPRPPYGHDYECSPQTKLSSPPTDGEIADLERRCEPGQVNDSGSSVSGCPCAELGIALSQRKDPSDRERGIRILMKDCEFGSLLACDSYKLERAMCLRYPSRPTCAPVREAGLIPEEMPLREVLGCRRQDRSVVCFEKDRYFVRDADGQWDQARIQSWYRDDEPKQARWVAQLPSGALVNVTRGYVKSDGGKIPSGYSLKLSAAELSAAKRATQALPKVEQRCRAVYKCLEAIATQRTPPAPPPEEEGEWEEPELEVPFADLLTSLRGCERARTLGLASLDSQAPPTACGAK